MDLPQVQPVLVSLSVGDASLSNVTVIVADIFSALSQAVSTRFDGILGYNLLSRFKTETEESSTAWPF